MKNNHKKFIKPLFPVFKKLEIDDREWMEEYIQKFTPYSDFNFVSLWSWNINDKAEVSVLNENLVVKFYDYITGEPFYTFLGKNSVIPTIKKIFQKCDEEKIPRVLKLVPEEIVNGNKLLEHNFLYKEDQDNNDYIFFVDEHANLRGRKFSDKRNLINKFKKYYPSHEVKLIDLNFDEYIKSITEMFDKWRIYKKLNIHKTQHEHVALARIIAKGQELNIKLLGLFINNKIIGFMIFNIIHNSFAVAHFEKVDLNYKGASAILRHNLAKILKQNNIKYINYEQDLGIDGLKKSKLYWNPKFFIKKFIIYEKNDIDFY